MQFNQLEQFCSMARHQHISKAAAELYVSQPTLSLNLARLEEELGVPLFDRVGRNIILNDYGKIFYYHAKQVLKSIEFAKREIEDLSMTSRTPVVFADALFNDIYLILEEYLLLNSDVKVIHLELTISDILSKLESGEIQFGIVVKQKGHDFGNIFKWKLLLDTELMVLMHRSNALADMGSINLTDLEQEDFMCAIKGFDTRDAFDSYCKDAGVTPRYKYTSTKPYLFNELTRKYGYVSIMSKIIYDSRETPTKDLIGIKQDISDMVALKIKDPVCLVEFGILTNKNYYLSNETRKIIDYIVRYFQENAGLF